MTPREKAEELVGKYSELGIGHPTSLLLPKQCALITVNEIIKEFGTYYKIQYDNKYTSYWESIKKEIEKL